MKCNKCIWFYDGVCTFLELYPNLKAPCLKKQEKDEADLFIERNFEKGGER